jgi:flavin reductase (DIM6/NTAB) family NADH-FMN oxidoreductase RutF
MKIERKPSTALLPAPVVLVTVADESGAANMLTIAWAGTVCSDPPMLSVAIRPTRYSYGLAARAREFVVNIPRASQLEQVDLAGVWSGVEHDKFTELGLTPTPASRVAPPLIQECPINLECQVYHQLSLGAHDLFIAEIVAVHYDEELLDPRGRLQTSRLEPLAYMEGEYWSLGHRLGAYGQTLKAHRKQ